jgi:hypothetical protein
VSASELHQACTMKIPFACFALLAAAPAFADVPGFDRPGISFSTTTLPPGTFDLEQGLPDLADDDAGGVRATLLSAGTLIRVGVADRLELQLSTALYNRVRVREASGSQTGSGIGDSGVAFKLALPSSIEPLSWAVLGGASFATGDDAFSAGETGYSLGATWQWSLDDARALAFYADVDRAGGENAYTVSPSYGFAVADRVAAFVEAGATHAGGANDYVGGGGVTFMWFPTIQLDAYADAGLTSRSTDLQAGIGISAYFD